MKILVMGSKGQLARSLVERAVEHPGLELHTVGRPEIDLEQAGSAAIRILRARPALVINAAAYTAVDQAEDEPDRAYRINAEAAGEIAAAAASIGAAVFQVSTDYVFDGSCRAPFGENVPTAPLNVYGASKLAGEAAVRAANPDHLIVRTAWLYSPFGRNFVTAMVGAAKARKMLTVVDDQVGSPTSALDLADALLMAAGRVAKGTALLGRTLHFAGGGSTSWYGLAEAIMADLQRRGLAAAELIAIPASQWPAKAARPSYSVLDLSCFAETFGVPARPWEESLAIVVDRLVSAES